MIQKTPCPSCGEPNFNNDVMCWKCGKPLHKKEPPVPTAEPVTHPETPPEEVKAPDSQPNAIMEAVIAMETEEATYSKNFMLAVILGGIIGALASILFGMPFYSWIRADSLPFSVATPFILLTTLGGAAAGVLAVYNPYGALAGMAVYAVSLILLRIFAVAPSMIAPPEIWTYHLFSGYFIAFAGMIGAVLVLRLTGRRILPPALSAKNPLRQKRGLMVALPIIMAVILIFSMSAYRGARDAASNDPARVIAGFCWNAASGWNGDSGTIGYLLSSTFSQGSTSSLKPNWPLPSQRTIKSLALGGATDCIQVTPRGSTAEVILKTSSDSSWTPGLLKTPGGDTDSEYLVRFDLSQEDGAWKIADVPSVSFPGDQ